MKKEILMNATSLETRTAMVEDAKLVELYVETHEDTDEETTGNIYYGKIENVLKGIQAAFVDIGFSNNAFLPFSEIGKDANISTVLDADEKDTDDIRFVNPIGSIDDLVTGRDVLVQIVKEPWGDKGARVTSNISLPGRYLVFVPYTNYVGISKKITNYTEKRRLKKLAHRLKPDGFGLIVRTVAEKISEEAFFKDMQSLIATWEEIQKTIKRTKAPTLVYSEPERTSKVIRDLFTEEINRVLIDNRTLHKKIKNYVKNVSPEQAHKVHYYDSGYIFETHNIIGQIEESLRRKVWLKSGGHIVIEHTEALVSIDVNSGKFIGRKDQEKNSLKINLEAAIEIARQLRLRDIGGLIVIDYIDMYDQRNKIKLVKTFRQELHKDRAKVVVGSLSDFGLLEMTRQRTRMSLLFSVSEECPVCKGLGRIPSKESVVTKIDNWIRNFRRHNREFRIVLKLHPDMKEYIQTEQKMLFRKLRWKYLLKIDFVDDKTMGIGEFKVFSKKNGKDLSELY